jgi:hypothetical protein
MQTGEGNQIDGQFSEVTVELTGKSKAASDSRHGSRDEMVEITVGGGSELEGSEADVIEGLIINDHALVGVLDELMNGESGIVGLDDGVRDFR